MVYCVATMYQYFDIVVEIESYTPASFVVVGVENFVFDDVVEYVAAAVVVAVLVYLQFLCVDYIVPEQSAHAADIFAAVVVGAVPDYCKVVVYVVVVDVWQDNTIQMCM